MKTLKGSRMEDPAGGYRFNTGPWRHAQAGGRAMLSVLAASFQKGLTSMAGLSHIRPCHILRPAHSHPGARRSSSRYWRAVQRLGWSSRMGFSRGSCRATGKGHGQPGKQPAARSPQTSCSARRRCRGRSVAVAEIVDRPDSVEGLHALAGPAHTGCGL